MVDPTTLAGFIAKLGHYVTTSLKYHTQFQIVTTLPLLKISHTPSSDDNGFIHMFHVVRTEDNAIQQIH
jgi:hypothetical protein